MERKYYGKTIWVYSNETDYNETRVIDKQTSLDGDTYYKKDIWSDSIGNNKSIYNSEDGSQAADYSESYFNDGSFEFSNTIETDSGYS